MDFKFFDDVRTLANLEESLSEGIDEFEKELNEEDDWTLEDEWFVEESID